MAGATLETVLENLNSLELELCLSFNQDTKRLASLLTTIKATLEDAEQKQLSNRAVKDWLEKLKDAAHVLDDILDEFASESLRLEGQGVNCGPSNKVQSSCLSSFHPRIVAFRCKNAKKMKKISERLEAIAEESTNFHLTKMEMVPRRESGVTEWRQKTLFVTESKVYGREEDTDKIVDFLTGYVSHSENASVYTIVGETISKQDLIEHWMANGFIPSSETLDAEDTGDSMWNELYCRSFFQDIETDELGKVKSFKMDDLVHDLAKFLAEDVCCITYDDDVTTLSDTIHHVQDHRAAWDVSEASINSMQLQQVKSLRTYIGQLYPVIFKCYSLRVLWCTAVKEVSNSISDLKHLRYLNLSQGNFKTLPESLGKLWNLHILKLDYCYRLKELPNGLTRLKALQQLSLKDCYNLSSLPPHLGKLTCLEKLSTYFVGRERRFHLAELGSLKLKGYLQIKHLEKVKSVTDAKEANLSNKQLNKLYLSWEENEESELQENVEEILGALEPDTQELQSLTLQGYKGANFPLWVSSSCSLKELAIVGCRKFKVSSGFECLEDLLVYRCKEVEHLHEGLQRMTSLQSLRLWDLPNVESLSGCFANLPLLRSLSLLHLPNLKSLPHCFGDLPLLRSLVLRDLPNVESLPDCFGNFGLLRELVIGECSKLTCLPASLNLKSLVKVEIYHCPSLFVRREHQMTP
ncbi:hypothetical protein VNO80_25636 [Phaseolus coccineus]|uniref:Rx N-terminal domain-containing protein n=1 Tax=Phaseolus coccineus TaxID=3886 RepID=A0AAN9LV71_PHACN